MVHVGLCTGFAVPCCAVLCRAVPCCAVLCRAVVMLGDGVRRAVVIVVVIVVLDIVFILFYFGTLKKHWEC